MSSANCDMNVEVAGFGMLATYMIKRMGLSAEPCGTPKLILMRGDGVLLIWKYV